MTLYESPSSISSSDARAIPVTLLKLHLTGSQTLQVHAPLFRDATRGVTQRPGLTVQLGRMLEEPEYSDIVRWGKNNDSFVVLEV